MAIQKEIEVTATRIRMRGSWAAKATGIHSKLFYTLPGKRIVIGTYHNKPAHYSITKYFSGMQSPNPELYLPTHTHTRTYTVFVLHMYTPVLPFPLFLPEPCKTNSDNYLLEIIYYDFAGPHCHITIHLILDLSKIRPSMLIRARWTQARSMK